MIWHCPHCYGVLNQISDQLHCRSCHHVYDSIAGIPDLRLPGPDDQALEEDRQQARWLANALSAATAAELVQHIFSSRVDSAGVNWDAARATLRTRQVLAAPARLHADLDGWLRPCRSDERPWLDVGCGPGMLQAAAVHNGQAIIGIDLSMVWLIVAQRLITEAGGQPILAAARAEQLPLDDASISAAIALDVIEHVAEPAIVLRELDRVIQPGGWLAMTTPNRFSLAAEPHVSVWGVGWLPRAWQSRYVSWRSTISYAHTCLLSSWEISRLLRHQTRITARILIPPVPEEEIRHFSPSRARLARLYNRLARLPLTRPLFLAIGPFFRILGQKQAALPAPQPSDNALTTA